MNLKRFRLTPILALPAIWLVTGSVATAGVSGTGGGNMVINTVYNTVVQQDITDVTTQVLNAELADILGQGSVLSGSTLLASFSVENIGLAINLTDLTSQTADQLHTDLFSVYPSSRTLEYNTSSSFLGSNTVALQPVVTSQLTGTTTTHATSVSVAETPGAIVIGDPSDLQADLTGYTVVIQGTVTVTDSETTILT